MESVNHISDLYVNEVIRPFLPNVILGSWSQNSENISLKVHEFRLFNNSKFEAAIKSDFIHHIDPDLKMWDKDFEYFMASLDKKKLQ